MNPSFEALRSRVSFAKDPVGDWQVTGRGTVNQVCWASEPRIISDRICLFLPRPRSFRMIPRKMPDL